jgi:hypothetical protein
LSVQRALTLSELRRYEEALAAWDEVLADDAGQLKPPLPALRKRFDWGAVQADGAGRYRHLWTAARALTQARREGQSPAPLLRALAGPASREADAYQQTELLNGSLCCTLATIHAVAAGVSAQDERAERSARQAIELLERAHRAGYFSARGRVAALEQDREFATLRPRADFQALLACLKTCASGPTAAPSAPP